MTAEALILFLLPVTILSLDKNRTHVVSLGSRHEVAECKSWQEARSRCVACERVCKLPVIRNTDDYKRVITFMRRNDLDAAWLGLQRKWLGEFLWLDCSKPPKSFQAVKWSKNLNCGFLQTKFEALNAAMCHENDKGVICQKRESSELEGSTFVPFVLHDRTSYGCKRCSAIGVHKVDCINIGDVCYIRKYHDLNWETAKAFCSLNGWEMAVFSQNEAKAIISNISKTFIGGFLDVDQKAYWIGLRREEWTFIDSGFSKNAYWSVGEPRRRGNCSVMIKSSRGYLWRSVLCSSKYPALCLKSEESARSTSWQYEALPTPVSFTRKGFPSAKSTVPSLSNTKCDCPPCEYPRTGEQNRGIILGVMVMQTVVIGALVVFLGLQTVYFGRGLPRQR